MDFTFIIDHNYIVKITKPTIVTNRNVSTENLLAIYTAIPILVDVFFFFSLNDLAFDSRDHLLKMFVESVSRLSVFTRRKDRGRKLAENGPPHITQVIVSCEREK